MSNWIEDVAEFHRAMNQPVKERCELPKADRVRLRLRLVTEEYAEFLHAHGMAGDAVFDALELLRGEIKDFNEFDCREVDMVAVAKESQDLKYVVTGTELEYGLPSEPLWDAVQESNLSKLGPDGKPVYRADGKVIKGPNYKAPDIARILREKGGWDG